MTRPSRTGGKTSGAKARNAGPAKGRKTTKTKPRIAPAATRVKRRSVSDPSQDLKEAREQQAATAEILKVIASSPDDVQPVFDAIAQNANRLIGGFSAAVTRFVGETVHLAAFTSTDKAGDEALKASFPRPLDDTSFFWGVRNGEVVQISDTETDTAAWRREMARSRGFRSQLLVPLMSDGLAIGLISVTRVQTGSFADHHIQLLQTFADQAVIAIENVRLFEAEQARTRDLTEALQQQTATADVLKVISRSAFDLETVLDALLSSACRLCEADIGTIRYKEGGEFRLAATFGCKPEWIEHFQRYSTKPDRSSVFGQTIAEGHIVHIPDLLADPDYKRPEAQKLIGFRAALGVPLAREGEAFGVINLFRFNVSSFEDRQIKLVQTFADQAVIAIENVRLFEEVQAKTRDLSEALTHQTGSGNILRVIASSPTNISPALQAIVESACELCDALDAIVLLEEGDSLRNSAHHGPIPLAMERWPITRKWVAGRAFLDRKSVHVHDMLSVEGDEFPDTRERARRTSTRTYLCVPLVREGKSIGTILLRRTEVHPFSDKQIALLQTFADQAVIAIGNVRLFEEVQAKTRDLTESLQQQTATADVLKVISRSAFDLQSVLDTLTESAARLCDADMATVTRQGEDGHFYHVTNYNFPPDWIDYTKAVPLKPGRGTVVGRALQERKAVQISDVLADAEYTHAEYQKKAGYRTFLGVPLLREGLPIGVLSLCRRTVQPFSEKQIELVSTFADQAVIAIENVRLFNETQEALERQTATADILKVIASSPSDVQPVFQAIADQSNRLLNGLATSVYNVVNDVAHLMSFTPVSPAADAFLKSRSPVALAETAWGGSVLKGDIFTIADTESEPVMPRMRDISRIRGWRSALIVPLLRDRTLIGAISVTRREPGAFATHHVELLKTFADQAVIAIENARLFEEVQARTAELTEALEQQTATSEVLGVISQSLGQVEPVFQSMLANAMRICEAQCGAMFSYAKGAFRAVSCLGGAPGFETFLREERVWGRETGMGRAAHTKQPVHVVDTVADRAYADQDPGRLAAVEIGGVRTFVIVPMLKDGELIGAMSLYRREVRAYTEKQIRLVSTFADQAVIAVENARLFDEVQARTRDLTEALTYQTGSANILSVIASSPTDVGPVLKAIVESACELCGAYDAVVLLKDGDNLRPRAHHGPIPFPTEKWPVNRNWAAGRAFLDQKPVHVRDFLSEEGDDFADGREFARRVGFRTALVVPLLREGESIGVVGLRRNEVHPFSDKQIALLQTFADQAVIAIGNVRLFEEVQTKTRDLTESLEQQTATSEVLEVISSTPGDLEPVFDKMLENATRVCGANFGTMNLVEDGVITRVASYNVPSAYADASDTRSFRPHPKSSLGQVIANKEAHQILDLLDSPAYLDGDPAVTSIVRNAGARSLVSVPMLRDTELIGTISVYGQEVRPFSGKQIELLSNFAKQAVIAIENTRLLKELRESLQQQTATADVLKIISRSSVDLETVLDTLVETVMRLCRADQTVMFRRRDDKYHLVAACGLTEEAKDFVLTHPFAVDRGTISGRVVLEHRAVHVADVLQDPEYTYREAQKIAEFRTILGIPLLREQTLIGIFSMHRTRVEPFTDKEIELASSFADQAVIAIENARLFEELHGRQAELRVTFDNMGDGVVMFDAAARLTAWNRNFQEILDLPDAFLAGRPSFAEYFRYLADRGEYSIDLEAQLSRTIEDTSREMRFERARPDGRVIEVRRNTVPGGGFVLIYSDITERKHAEEAIRTARDAAEAALRDLQTAQDRLVQTEKLASLGQLTAGIAHEIKNPLNFVNNFSALSAELTDELNDVLKPVTLDSKVRGEVDELTGLLKDNLEKVVQHGQRADSIVKNMLLHSREGSREHRPADINSLLDESLNLAYHGARAEKGEFNITLQRDFDADAGTIELFPQEITRALLNLIANGVYAATRRKAEDDEPGFEPTLWATTKNLGTTVEIRIRDNGTGISAEVKEKMFNPFFTTKPAGEGTGLGLSMAHDIIVKQHGGKIDVETEPGNFTEFIIVLPRKSNLSVRERGEA